MSRSSIQLSPSYLQTRSYISAVNAFPQGCEFLSGLPQQTQMGLYGVLILGPAFALKGRSHGCRHGADEQTTGERRADPVAQDPRTRLRSAETPLSLSARKPEDSLGAGLKQNPTEKD